MEKPGCKLHALLANTEQDYSFNEGTFNFLKSSTRDIIVQSGKSVENVLFIHFAESERDCDPAHKDLVREIFENRDVHCIRKGLEREQIEQAEAIAIGGGDLTQLRNAMASYGSTLWAKALSGVPVVGWNTGAAFLSALNCPGSEGLCQQLNGFPLLVIPHYSNDSIGYNKVLEAFRQSSLLEYALCLPPRQEASGIVIEESRTGLAGGNTDSSGGGGVTTSDLTIYQRAGVDGINQVPFTQNQINHLPINYW